MILTESNLMEYIKCPVKYFLSKRSKQSEIETFNSLVHETYNSYISKVSNLNVKDDSTLMQKKWDNTCQKNRNIITDKKVIEGWGLLFSAYNYLSQNEIKFVDTSLPYRIEIEGSKMTLVGNLDPFIDRGDIIEFLIPSFSKTMPDRTFIDMKLKHTIDAYAIKEMFNKSSVFKYHSFYFNKDIYTFRDDMSFNRLKKIITNVGTAIENDLIYPSESHACSTCMYRGLCKAWGTINDEVK